MVVAMRVALFVFTLGLAAMGTGGVDPHLVHFGDIKLEPCEGATFCKTDTSVVGTLMIYCGDNYRAPEWRPVCKDGFADSDHKGSKAICNILGYKNGVQYNSVGITPQQAHFSNSTDYALTQLDCTNTLSNGAPPNHLLRCAKFSLFDKDTSTCTNHLNLNCSIPKGYPLPDASQAYEGQLALCPPDTSDTFGDVANPARQISMGIVSVMENTYWGSLNQNGSNHMITRQQADSICRQLGFTGAVLNSARTVSSYDGQYSFTNCQPPDPLYSQRGLQRIWLTVDNCQQCEISCPCFSCCYKQPGDGKQFQGGTWNYATKKCSPQGHCCRENDIVLECTFDQTSILNKPPESGSETTCGFHSSLLSSDVCSESKMFTERELLAGILVPTGLLCVTIFIMVVSLIACKRKYGKHNDYNRIPDGNGGGNGNEH